MNNTLFSLIPKIRRARGYRLYDEKGNRIIDCYQNNGHAILGHRGIKLSATLKNMISKGMIYDLPSRHEAHFRKALRIFVPGFDYISFIRSEKEALTAAAHALDIDISSISIFDPAAGETEGTIALFRPFIGFDYSKTAAVIPVLPFSMGNQPCVICFRDKPLNDTIQSETVSPFLLAGATRAIHDLKKFLTPSWLKDDLLKESMLFRQEGMYFRAITDELHYREIFRKFLDNGILLSPDFPGPSVFPAELSDGEFSGLMKLLLEKQKEAD